MKVVRENAKKRPIPSALLEPFSAVEGRSEWRDCEACGRATEYRPGQPTFCSDQCRSYVPRSLRKFDGDWFVVAGPVDYCQSCHMAITPRKPHGYLTPYRVDGQLRCDTCISNRLVRRARKSPPERV